MCRSWIVRGIGGGIRSTRRYKKSAGERRP
jgi:hypothetical protein